MLRSFCSHFYLLVLYAYRYTESAEKMSFILRDELHTPVERAVFWTEHVLRHNGTKHLNLAARDLAFYQRALIDVYALILALIVVPIFLMGLCCRKCCCKSKKVSTAIPAKKTQ